MTVSLWKVASIVGIMFETAVAILPAPLHYQSLQCPKNAFPHNGHSCQHQVSLSFKYREELKWCIQHLQEWNGRSLRVRKPDLIIQCRMPPVQDVQDREIAATSSPLVAGGHPQRRPCTRNALELLAGQYTLQSLTASLCKGSILLQMDNNVAVACCFGWEANTSLTLNSIAASIWEWCLACEISLILQYLPGVVANAVEISTPITTQIRATGCWTGRYSKPCNQPG